MGRHRVELLFQQLVEGRWVSALSNSQWSALSWDGRVDDILFSLPSRVTRADCGCWRTLRLTCELGVIFISPVFLEMRAPNPRLLRKALPIQHLLVTRSVRKGAEIGHRTGVVHFASDLVRLTNFRGSGTISRCWKYGDTEPLSQSRK